MGTQENTFQSSEKLYFHVFHKNFKICFRYLALLEKNSVEKIIWKESYRSLQFSVNNLSKKKFSPLVTWTRIVWSLSVSCFGLKSFKYINRFLAERACVLATGPEFGILHVLTEYLFIINIWKFEHFSNLCAMEDTRCRLSSRTNFRGLS